MINVGLHFDTMDPNHPDPAERDSGLCVIPGTHRQDFMSMLLRKFYFLSHEPDRAEVCLPTKQGDLTVHDGRLWHRVQKSGKSGVASVRRSAFMPYLTSAQPVEHKNEESVTPFYHYIGMMIRAAKGGA
jgi:ectoine hydroxylase-related dioxygenase (phytanoyl-CoA dioxygenase family)